MTHTIDIKIPPGYLRRYSHFPKPILRLYLEISISTKNILESVKELYENEAKNEIYLTNFKIKSDKECSQCIELADKTIVKHSDNFEIVMETPRIMSTKFVFGYGTVRGRGCLP